MAYSVKKAGVSFKTKVNVDPDLTGKAANFALTYYDDSASGTEIVVSGSFVESVDIPGLYFSPDVTVASAGDYTFNIANSVDGLGNVSVPVVVVSATVDDVKVALDAAQTDITAIRDTTDLLNTAELEGISEKITEVQTTVNSVNDLIVNKTANLTFSGVDETANLVVGDDVLGNTSGAIGKVVSSVFGTDTVVGIESVVGTFEAGETITGTGTSGAVSSVANGNAAVDSVMEFVSEINAALENGASGLSALAEFTDNLELMLEGKAYTDTNGVSVSESDSKGLSEIFAEIVANGVDIGTAQTSITNVGIAVGTLQTSVDDGFIAIEASVAAFKLSVEGKVDDVKTVVDANSVTLSSGVHGNAALKSLLDTLTTNLGLVDDDADAIIATLADGTFGLSAIKTLLNTMDGKLDSIEGKVDDLVTSVGSSTAKVFV
jgi:hypothetical protein